MGTTDFRDNGVQWLLEKVIAKGKKAQETTPQEFKTVKRKPISRTNIREGTKPIPTRSYWFYKCIKRRQRKYRFINQQEEESA